MSLFLDDIVSIKFSVIQEWGTCPLVWVETIFPSGKLPRLGSRARIPDWDREPRRSKAGSIGCKSARSHLIQLRRAVDANGWNAIGAADFFTMFGKDVPVAAALAREPAKESGLCHPHGKISGVFPARKS